MAKVLVRAWLCALLLAAAVPPSVSDAASRPAPPFDARLLAGGTLRLADLRGTPAILLFWAPWCPTCNAEAPGWEHAYRQWKGKGIQIVGFGLLDTKPAVEAFVQKYHLTFPNAYDDNGRIAKAYGFTVQPYWAVISKDGTLLRAEYGPASVQALDAQIESLAGR
jgi:peroxiredoxin